MKKLSNKFLLRTVLIGGILIFLLPQVVLAQTDITGGEVCKFDKAKDGIQQQFHIPGVTKEIGGKFYVKNLGCYIIGIYRYFASIAGILATVMIMWGGVKYVVSFGNQQKVADAKEQITAALIGLLLVLSSYAILYFINPNLTTFNLTGVVTIDPYLEGWCEEREGSVPKVEDKVNCGDVGIDKNDKDCYYQGQNCSGDTICVPLFGGAACADIDDVCEEANESDVTCKKIDDQFKAAGVSKMCLDTSTLYSFIKDKTCRPLPLLKCNNNWQQVDCNVGNNKDTKCWDDGEGAGAGFTFNRKCEDGRTHNLGNAICCADLSDVECRTKGKCHSNEIELDENCKLNVSGITLIPFLGQGKACDRDQLNNNMVCCIQLKLEWDLFSG